jgi:4-diphosphocytidyl-2-C-methyl-D-erythritol kinase
MRADGFHELRTVFQALALHDTIRCVPRKGAFAIECTSRACLSTINLIWRAAQTLWRSLRRVRSGARHRRPARETDSAAGRSWRWQRDAAATLLALAHAWRVPVKPSQLTDMAAHIGSDVPFFLSGGTALGLGRATRFILSRPAAALDRPADSRFRRLDQ